MLIATEDTTKGEIEAAYAAGGVIVCRLYALDLQLASRVADNTNIIYTFYDSMSKNWPYANKVTLTYTVAGADTEPPELAAKSVAKYATTLKLSPTDPTTVETALKYRCNPNLLDNWYFGNPVNQRGQTEYAGNATYSIDRWWTQYETPLSVVDGGIKIGGKWDVQQYFENTLPNATYTLSLLYRDRTGSDPLRLLAGNRTDGDIAQTESKDASGILSVTFSTATANRINFGFTGSTDNSAIIIAIKLKLGDTQTLAHKENGVWVLNEIPDFGEQLRRCRDYCRKIKYATYTGYAMGVAMSANFVRIPIFFEDMRTTPTVDLSSASGLFLTGAEGDVYGVTFTLAWSAPNCIVVDATKTGAFISGQNYFLRNDATSFILASADL